MSLPNDDVLQRLVCFYYVLFIYLQLGQHHCRTFSYGFISYMDDKIRVPSADTERIRKNMCFVCRNEKQLEGNRTDV